MGKSCLAVAPYLNCRKKKKKQIKRKGALLATCNTFVSNILSKKKKRKKKWFWRLLTLLFPASHVKQAGRKALGSSHVAQFIATLGFKPHNKLLPLLVQKLTQQRLHPELIPSWRSKINHSPKQTNCFKASITAVESQQKPVPSTTQLASRKAATSTQHSTNHD